MALNELEERKGPLSPLRRQNWGSSLARNLSLMCQERPVGNGLGAQLRRRLRGCPPPDVRLASIEVSKAVSAAAPCWTATRACVGCFWDLLATLRQVSRSQGRRAEGRRPWQRQLPPSRSSAGALEGAPSRIAGQSQATLRASRRPQAVRASPEMRLGPQV